MNVQAQTTASQPHFFNQVDQALMNTWVESTMAAMTPEQRVAQLIVMAVETSGSTAPGSISRYVAGQHVGGLIFMEGDASRLVSLVNGAQSQSKVPLLVTIDGEWGLKMRLKDAPAFRRNMMLGAVDNDQLLYEYGREVARECRRLGIHVNFAPVLDVNDHPSDGMLGTRSFGSDPHIVARHGIAYSRGLEDGGVISVCKHFPGHGSTADDSHKTLPLINKSMTELNLCELLPFRQYVKAGLSGVMVAHLLVPAIDKNAPTSLSRRAIVDLLRGQMGFQGLVFSDALTMKGATGMLSGSACVNALKAGNDILLMPGDPSAEIAAVMAAIARGEITQNEVDEHCRRVLRYKYALGLNKQQSVDPSHVSGDINTIQANVLQRQLTASSITVVKNNNNILPVRNLQSRHIAVVTVGVDKGVKSTFSTRCRDYAEVTCYDATSAASATVRKVKGDNQNLVLVAVDDYSAANAAALNQVAEGCKNVVLVLLCDPRDIKKYGEAISHKHVKAVVLGYDDDEMAQDYAAQTIFGGNYAAGILPIRVELPGNKCIKAGTGFHYAANRLGYGIPAEVGLDNRLLHQVDSVCRLGVKMHAFPGCEVLIARHGKVVMKRSYGEIDYGSGVPVTDETLFGLASVSKATGTLSGVMKAYDDGKFKLNDKASDIIAPLRGTDKENITFRDLLYHETGMPASLNMWDLMMDSTTYIGPLMTTEPDEMHTIKVMNKAYGNKTAKLRTDILSDHKTDRFNVAIADGIWGGQMTYDTVMQHIYHAKLGSKKYLYSCLNFSLLADAVQRSTHSPLNYLVNNYVFAPLGAFHTMYRPLSKFSPDQIAYTERDTYLRRQHIHGYVHDELAAFSGGVQGNAGLFSNANDLAKLFQMWLNGGTYGGHRFLKASTVETFLTQKSPNSHRGLGFDKPVVGNPRASNTCAEATPETIGHTGFTGTCFWIDPKNDFIYIFLSNRVCPTRDNPNFGRVSARSHIHSLIYKAIRD